MSDEKKETLQKKKKELEAELHSIQEELDDSLDQVRSDVSAKLDPLEHVRRHPIPAVGAAVFIGFLIGKGGEDHEHSHKTDAPGEKLTSTLSYEIKRLITRKGISFMSSYLEKLLR